MSFLSIWWASRGLNATVNADAISPCFGPCFEAREARARVATWFFAPLYLQRAAVPSQPPPPAVVAPNADQAATAAAAAAAAGDGS